MKWNGRKQLAMIVILVIMTFLVLYMTGTIRYAFEPFDNIRGGRGFAEIDDEYILPKIHENFITEQERDYILETAEPMFMESEIAGDVKVDAKIRKSDTAWIDRNDPVAKNVIGRVCKMVNIPFENAEALQVVRYKPGGFYKEHHDSYCDDSNEHMEFEKNGGQRKVTMVIYLSDDFEGGETNFPQLNQKFKPASCGGLLFYPFENKNRGRCHPKALHGGLPVISGEKYIVNVWLHEKEYFSSI